MKQFIHLTFYLIINQLFAQNWTPLTNFPGVDAEDRWDVVSFSVGNKIYEGIGANASSTSFYKDLWEYNTENKTWIQRPNYVGEGAQYLLGFAIGNLGYVGLGWKITGEYASDFWEYNSITSSWRRLADFPDQGRVLSSVFILNGKAYVFGGLAPNDQLKRDLWEYNPTTNIWTQKTSLPGQENRRMDAFAFSLNGQGYIGGGFDNLLSTGLLFNDLWRYDPITNQWNWDNYLPNLGQDYYGLASCATASSCDRAFIFLGNTYDGFFYPMNYRGWTYGSLGSYYENLPNFPATVNKPIKNGYFINGKIIGGFPQHYEYPFNEISGPTSPICTGGTFSISNLPLGTTVNWQSSNPAGISIDSNTGSSIRINNFNGSVTISGNLVGGTCNSPIITKKVVVGTPSPVITSTQISLPGDPTSYDFTATFYGDATYNWYVNNALKQSGPSNVFNWYFPCNVTRTIKCSYVNNCGTSGFSNSLSTTGACKGPALRITPNPASAELKVSFETELDIESSDSEINEVLLMNSNQEKIYSIKTFEPTTIIPVNKFPNGIYYLHIKNKHRILREKIIISH